MRADHPARREPYRTGWLRLLGLVLFILAVVDITAICLTDEQLADAQPLRFLATVVPFWVGIAPIFAAGRIIRLFRA